MSDSFVEVTKQGWFSRIAESIKEVLFGLLLIVVSVGVLIWNEGMTLEEELKWLTSQK